MLAAQLGNAQSVDAIENPHGRVMHQDRRQRVLRLGHGADVLAIFARKPGGPRDSQFVNRDCRQRQLLQIGRRQIGEFDIIP